MAGNPSVTSPRLISVSELEPGMTILTKTANGFKRQCTLRHRYHPGESITTDMAFITSTGHNVVWHNAGTLWVTR